MLSVKISRLLVICFVIFHQTFSIPVEKTQAEIRASLITKDSFKDHRNKKDLGLTIPKPFIVSTQLNIRGQPDQRRGRSYPDGKGNTIVEGVRIPDDKTDAMTYRNGRFINNIFVPNDAPVPVETVVSSNEKSPRVARMMESAQDEGRSFNPGFAEYYLGGKHRLVDDSMAVESRTLEHVVAAPRLGLSPDARNYNFHAGNTKKGRPVYYVVEEPDSLHADRSPYNFEPADNQDSFTDTVSDFTHAGVSQANQGDFVIKEHTYTMCPGCPTFSIPVPIPRASLAEQEAEQAEATSTVNYQSARDKNFLEKIGDRIVSTVKGFQDRTRNLIDPILNKSGSFLGLDDDSNTIKEKKGEDEGSKRSYLPMMLAGAAAVALGGIAVFGSGPAVSTINARKLTDEPSVQRSDDETQKILDAIDDASNKFE